MCVCHALLFFRNTYVLSPFGVVLYLFFSFLDERIPRALCSSVPAPYIRFLQWRSELQVVQLLAEAENLPAPGFGKGLSRVVFDLVWYLVRTSFWPRSWPAFVWSFFSMFSLLDMQNRSKTACKHILAAKTNFNLTMVPALAFPWCLASQLPFLDVFKSCLWHWVFTYELYPTYPSSTRVSIVTCTQNICAKTCPGHIPFTVRPC